MLDRVALIALDLDRTLFQSDGSISTRTLDAIAACRQKGLHIAIATARPSASVHRFLPAALHQDVPWVCGSGGSVYENGQCLHEDLIDIETAGQIVERLYSIDAEFICSLEMKGKIYVNRHVPGVLTPHEICDLREIVSDPVSKFLIHLDEDLDPYTDHPDKTSYPPSIHLSDLPPGCKVQLTDQGTRANILSPTVSKSNGLQFVLAERGLDFSRVIAFGDDISDIDMLEKSAIGVAMGNSVPEVMAIADRVTASNDEHGVAMVLEELLLKVES